MGVGILVGDCVLGELVGDFGLCPICCANLLLPVFGAVFSSLP